MGALSKAVHGYIKLEGRKTRGVEPSELRSELCVKMPAVCQLDFGAVCVCRSAIGRRTARPSLGDLGAYCM